jgi:hypothetical protein
MSQKLKKKKKKKIATKQKEKSSILGHRRIVLVIIAERVVELEALLEVQLILLYSKVDGVNLLLHGRDGLLHG